LRGDALGEHPQLLGRAAAFGGGEHQEPLRLALAHEVLALELDEAEFEMDDPLGVAINVLVP
jgi:hypothetical protein